MRPTFSLRIGHSPCASVRAGSIVRKTLPKASPFPSSKAEPCRYWTGTVQSGLTPCTVPQDLNGVVPGPCAITLDPQIGTNIVPMLEHIMNVLD